MKAVVVSVNWETEEVMWQFVDTDDPITTGEGVIRSIEDDFPNFDHFVHGDDDARKVREEQLKSLYGLE